jgi:pimeloyl-ACP methyl ester carboxylesterase
MRRDARGAREQAEQAARGDKEAAEKMFKSVLSDTWSESWLSTQGADFIDARAKQLSLLPPEYFAGSAALLRLLETLDLRDDLPGITARTVVMGGDDDRIFPPEHSRAIADAIPHAELKIVPGVGHGLLFERPDAVIDVLR